MSLENVEIVRGIYDAIARRDDETPFRLYSEDIAWDLSNAGRALLFTKPVFQGHEGVRQSWREVFAAFGEIYFEVEELLDGGQHVLAVIHERETGRSSGAPVETSHLAVWTLAGGKVIRMQVFDDRGAAFEAAGLSEEATSQENVEIVRRVVEAFNRRDWEAWESHWHRDGEWCDPPETPGSGVHRGVHSIRRYFEELLEIAADGWKVEISAISSVGRDRVLIEARSVLVGRESGVPIEDGLFQLVDLDDGRLRRVRNFRTNSEALEAVGLSE